MISTKVTYMLKKVFLIFELIHTNDHEVDELSRQIINRNTNNE